MGTTRIAIRIPENICKEIKWYLFNYNKLDKYIKYREDYLRNDVFDYYHFTNKNSIKNIHSYGFTLDNCIIAIEEDKVINKYKKWQKVIRSYLNDLENTENYIDYWIIKYAFFQDKRFEFIEEQLNLDERELKRELFIIIYELYMKAIDEELYEEVV